MPALSPSASRNTSPSGDADVLDGVVAVDVEVARRLHVEVEAAVAAELVEHVVEEREPGATPRRRRWGRRGRAAPRCSSPWWCAPWTPSRVMLRASSRAARNASSSAGVPIVTRRQPSRRGHDEQSRTSTDRSSSACHTSAPSRCVGPEQHEVGRRRPHRDRQLGQAGDEPAALLHQGGDAGAHGVVEVEGDAAGGLLHGVEVVRQHDLVELGDQRTRADEVAEAGRRHRPRLRVGAGDDERPVVVDQLERRPRGELAVGLVDDQRARARGRAPSRTVASSSSMPVGLFGEHRKVMAGVASASTRRTSSRSRARSSVRSPTATPVPVMRAMWLCSA